MKAYGYLVVALVLSLVAAQAVRAASGPAPKAGEPPGASGKATGQPPGGGKLAAHGGHPAYGKAPKNGGQPGGGKGSSSVNGTGMGAQH